MAEGSWKSCRDGPWPTVRIDGDLERAGAEWLHSDGNGAYAMSTAALMHTRRQHGLLVAALEPPLGQTVILSHAETTVEVGQRAYKLSTHQFPGVAPTPGYRWLKTFSQDPIPRWTYRFAKGVFERTLCIVHGKNAVVLSYVWKGQSVARLTLRPLLPLRPTEELSQEHGAVAQTVTLRSGQVEVQPNPSLPLVAFGHSGVFMGSPDWWRRFEYLADQGPYEDFQEDLWSPGVFEIELTPQVPTFLVVAVGALPVDSPQSLVERARARLLAHDPGPERPAAVRVLSLAAEHFVLDECPRPCIKSGYPALGVYARDWAFSVPGLLLARGQTARAARSLASLAGLLHDGLLPLTLPVAGKPRPRPSPDATLWLVDSVGALVEAGGPDDATVPDVLYPALVRVFLRLCGKRRAWAWLSEDGLLVTGAPNVALTWMDAQLSEEPYTPRRGLAVELQALWVRAASVVARLARQAGDVSLAERAASAADAARMAFRERFWCAETDYAFDCIGEVPRGPDAWQDDTLRPNALIALAVEPSLFDAWQAKAILDRVRQDLLTPRGVRTLSPADPRYVGHFSGSRADRESAYHQGTVWPYLIACYCRAVMRAWGDSEQVRLELGALVEGAFEASPALGHVAQLADGDPPFSPRGCPTSAASVAGLLSALVLELGR